MNHEYADPSFLRNEWYADPYSYGPGIGQPGGPVDATHTGTALTPPDPGWDPVEELAYLLQEAVPAEQTATVPAPRSESSPGGDSADPMENLAHITAQLPPIRRSPTGHRKVRVHRLRRGWLQTGSLVIIACVAVIAAAVSVFCGVVAYRPLQNITSDPESGVTPWWPLLVYGPWTVASLSILRTALHQRRAWHSWLIVLMFSSVAMMLCVAQADRTFTGVAAAALPALACLACLQQLVRQITLTLAPRQSPPRPRRRP